VFLLPPLIAGFNSCDNYPDTGGYYETLEQSSQNWHEGKHDPWPYINYTLSILKNAYREFDLKIVSIN